MQNADRQQVRISCSDPCLLLQSSLQKNPLNPQHGHNHLEFKEEIVPTLPKVVWN